jgi:DNA-binding transcriptional LysR family regulator
MVTSSARFEVPCTKAGVKLFDRSTRFPVLTDHGRARLPEARAVSGDLDLLKARAKSFAGGLEPELSVAVDVMFPIATFTATVAAFRKQFPAAFYRTPIPPSVVAKHVHLVHVNPVDVATLDTQDSQHRCYVFKYMARKIYVRKSSV